jgi:rubrerythrin
MPTTPSTLPDTIDALKALVLAERDARQSAETLAARERTTATQERARGDRLERLLKELQRALFGRRSERLDPDQLQLVLEDLEGAIAEAEAEKPGAKPRARRRNTNRGALPKHLPREEVVIEPTTTVCSCGSHLHRIGEDRSERLDVIPAQFRVIVTVRPKYACRACGNGVVQASAPARLIEGGLPTSPQAQQQRQNMTNRILAA